MMDGERPQKFRIGEIDRPGVLRKEFERFEQGPVLDVMLILILPLPTYHIHGLKASQSRSNYSMITRPDNAIASRRRSARTACDSEGLGVLRVSANTSEFVVSILAHQRRLFFTGADPRSAPPVSLHTFNALAAASPGKSSTQFRISFSRPSRTR